MFVSEELELTEEALREMDKGKLTEVTEYSYLSLSPPRLGASS